MECSFWWPISIKDTTKGHLIRANDTLITQEILRDLETVKIGAKDQLLEEKMLLVLIIILEIIKVLVPGIQELRIDFIIDREIY